MTWVRVESAMGVRYAAPSFATPPTIEGFNRLLDAPQRVRSFHCVEPHNGAEHTVLVARVTVGKGLGEVSLAVGGEGSTPQALEILRDAVLTVLVGSDTFLHSSLCGVQFLLDALCTRSTCKDDTSARSVFAEDDGFSALNLEGDEASYVDDACATDCDCSDRPHCNTTVRMHDEHDHIRHGSSVKMAAGRSTGRVTAPWRPALLYFLHHNVVPVSLLACRVVPRAVPPGHTTTAEPPHTAWRGSLHIECRARILYGGSKSRPDRSMLHEHAFWHNLGLEAELSCTTALRSLLHTLHAVYPERERLFCSMVWDIEDRTTLVMALSPSGLLFASAFFYHVLRHTDRLVLCALAIDQLTRRTGLQGDDRAVSSCVRFGFAWSGLHGPAMEMLVWCIGDALCYILGFTRSPDTPVTGDNVGDPHNPPDITALSAYLLRGVEGMPVSTTVQDLVRPLQLIATHATAAGDAPFFDALAGLTSAPSDAAIAAHARHCHMDDVASVTTAPPSLASPLLLLSSEGAVVDVQDITTAAAETASTAAAASIRRSRTAENAALSRLVISPPHTRGLHRLLGCVPFCVGRTRRTSAVADRSLPSKSTTSRGGTAEVSSLAQRVVAAAAGAGRRRAIEALQAQRSSHASSSRHATHLTSAIDDQNDNDDDETRWLMGWMTRGDAETSSSGGGDVVRVVSWLYAAALVTRSELQSFRAIDEARLHSCFWMQRAADEAGFAQYVVGIFRPQVQYRGDGVTTRAVTTEASVVVLHDAPAVLRLSVGHYPLHKMPRVELQSQGQESRHKAPHQAAAIEDSAPQRSAQTAEDYCYYSQTSVLPLSLLTYIVPCQPVSARPTAYALADNDCTPSSEVVTSFYRLYMHRLRTHPNKTHVPSAHKTESTHRSVPIEEVFTMLGDAVRDEKEVLEAMWRRGSDRVPHDTQSSASLPLRVVCEELICCQAAAHAIFDSLYAAT